jgi:hypothetical protein
VNNPVNNLDRPSNRFFFSLLKRIETLCPDGLQVR